MMAKKKRIKFSFCPCNLSQARVLEMAKEHGFPLIRGRCQNPLSNGDEGVCGRPIGAHPDIQQGKLFQHTIQFV